MELIDIEKELIKHGKDPKDFNINITENGYSTSPKWYFENKQIAKKEDKPIIEDLNDVAELTTMTSMDKDELAEMLVYALQRIDELEVIING